MNQEQMKSRLIQIAAEMANGRCMPLEFIEDWRLPKTTPITAKREIEVQAKAARQQCRAWANQIMEVVREGLKS